MKVLRGIYSFLLFFVLIFSFSICLSASENATFMRSELYTSSEYEDLNDLGFSVIARTSFFSWKDQNGASPKMKQEKALPAYVLLLSSESCIAELSSSLDEPLDAYDFRNLNFAVRIKDEDSILSGCKIILTLFSGEHKLEINADISFGIWNVVSFDVSHWKYRKNITGMTLAFVGSDSSLPLDGIEISGPYVRESERPKMSNFMSAGLSALGTELEIVDKGSENESLRIYLNSQRVNISGVAAPIYTAHESNSVKIALTNNSMLNSFVFSYDLYDPENGRYSSVTKNVSIEPFSENSVCYINTGDVSMISDFSIILDSAAQGVFTIHSISPVRLYEGYNGNVFGEIVACKKDQTGKNLLIEGNVYHNYLTSHNDHTLLCYMLSPDESLEDAIESGKAPVGELKMSSRFLFEIKLSTLGEYAMVSKYAVASRSSEGEITQLFAPVSTMSSFSTSKGENGSANIKGIEYEDVSIAVDCGVGYAIVDVLLDKLVRNGHSGHLYSTGKDFIYFDADYVSSLDKKVKNLHASGCKVYLRLLISKDADRSLLPYAAKTEINHALYLSVDIEGEDAKRHFYGVVDFLSSRYSKISNGKITGFVLGKSVDRPELYNGSPRVEIVEYTKMLSEAFELMARCAAESLDKPEVILPISDIKNGILGFDSEQLLVSFCRYIEEGGGLDFSLMLEGTENYGLTNENKDYHSFVSFEKMLKNLSFASKNAPDSYIYLFSPTDRISETDLTVCYAYAYYNVMFSENASALVLSLDENNGGREIINALSHMIKYIDTEKNKNGELCRPALEALSVNGWDELITGYDEGLIEYRVFKEAKALYSLPENVKGRYSLWDFSSAFGNQDWFEGNGCASVYIDSSSIGDRALCAVMDGENEYSDIVYKYEFFDDILLMPYLGFDIFIDDDSGALYEISVTLGGDGNRIESNCALKGGEKKEIIVDTSLSGEMKRLDYIRISIRAINEEKEGSYKLYLHSVNAYSDKMGDSDLKSAVERTRALARNLSVTTSAKESVEPKYEFIIAIAVIIVIGVAMVGFYERKQR